MSNSYAAKVVMDHVNTEAGLYCGPRLDAELRDQINLERHRQGKPPMTLPSEQVSNPVNEGIDATLDERGKRYGSYMEKAYIIQDIKKILRAASSWEKMDPDMQESLEMVVHKIGRIVTGDPEYLDSWVDVAGYVTLIVRRLEGKPV